MNAVVIQNVSYERLTKLVLLALELGVKIPGEIWATYAYPSVRDEYNYSQLPSYIEQMEQLVFAV
jgi:hypothetical protein